MELRPQSREVLRILAARPGETISKEEFAAAVWDGRRVGEDSLVQCIAEIRAALGDGKRTIIQTVPRKGYRLNPGAARQTPFRGRTGRIAVAALVLAVAAIAAVFALRDGPGGAPEVVAVLPLEDLSPAPHRGFLNDALAEGIITELARFNQFRVVARNSSFQFRDTPTDVRRIGEILGAGYLVEGSQQYDGSRLKVTIQLIEAGSGIHLFASSYERDIDDLFEVQNRIVRQVASVVGEQVLSEMPERALPRDVDSRLRGLRARSFMHQLSRENWEKAMELEETSIREEPHSAWGYIGKSLMLYVAARLGWEAPHDEVLAEARGLAETALRLDGENYMSHYAMARVLTGQQEFERAIAHFRRAADINPSDPIVHIGVTNPLLYLGRTEEALASLAHAAEVDPLHGDWLRWQQGWAHWQAGDCEKGLAAMQSMEAPNPAAKKTLATILVCLGRISEARSALGEFLATRPGYTRGDEDEFLPAVWKPEGTRERYLDDLAAAGMP